MLVDGLMSSDGVVRGNGGVKWIPGDTISQLAIGDRIGLTAADVERLAAAFFAGLERKFV